MTVGPEPIWTSPAVGGTAEHDAVLGRRRDARLAAGVSGVSGPGALGDEGAWLVRTEMSGYLIDRDAGTVTRMAGQGVGMDPEVPGQSWVAELRQDVEPVPLLSVDLCVEGERAIFLIDVRGDGISTVRRTSLVRSVERIPGGQR